MIKRENPTRYVAELTENDVFELRRLRDNIKQQLDNERKRSLSKATTVGVAGTSDSERDLTIALETLNRVLKQQ